MQPPNDEHEGIETDAQFIADWTQWAERNKRTWPSGEPTDWKVMSPAYNPTGEITFTPIAKLKGASGGYFDR